MLGSYEPVLEELKQEHEELSRAFTERIEGYRQRVRQVWQAIQWQLQENMVEVSRYPVPQAYLVDEIGEGLYNSKRDYLEQIAAYKEFQGKSSEVMSF